MKFNVINYNSKKELIKDIQKVNLPEEKQKQVIKIYYQPKEKEKQIEV